MINFYKFSFKGYPAVFWYFFLATFINKAGALVMPFLSRFLNDDMKFSFNDTGWIFFFLGLGTVFGTFLSGYIIDKFGSFKLIIFSLIGSSVFLFALTFVKQFSVFCFLIFCFSFITDMLRPAILITLKHYVPKEKRVQSISLIRNASNLGLIIGPLLGGFVLVNSLGDYKILFIIDSLSCLLACLLVYILVNEKKLLFKLKNTQNFSIKFAPYQDRVFLLNCIVTCFCGILFFQFFSIFPLYFNENNKHEIFKVDYLISLLALLIALFEIYIVQFYISKKYYNTLAVGIGISFFLIGYAILVFSNSLLGNILYVFCIVLAAMHTFPFAINIVISRTHKNQEGVFMAIFQTNYGISQMISGKFSMEIVNQYGFALNWKVNIIIAVIALLINHLIYLKIKSEKVVLHEKLSSYF